MKRRVSEWREGRRTNSRVAEAPAEMVVCEGERTAEGDAQGYPVDVGPRPGAETGVEIVRHAVGTGDPGGGTKEQQE